MGWEKRGLSGHRYYYKKTRDAEGRVVSTYLGRGLLAHLVAEVDAARHAVRRYRQQALRTFASDVDTAGEAVRAYTDHVQDLLSEALEQEGYRYHRGEWRRPRKPKIRKLS